MSPSQPIDGGEVVEAVLWSNTTSGTATAAIRTTMRWASFMFIFAESPISMRRLTLKIT